MSYKELTKELLFFPVAMPEGGDHISSCTTLQSIVNLFNVLDWVALVLEARRIAVQSYGLIFELPNFSATFFQKFFRADSFRIPGKPALQARKQRFRRDLRPKSECKVRHFERTHQIFQQQISTRFVQST